jgi:MurNAc alpha-1-phosphate uridylyltransferase
MTPHIPRAMVLAAGLGTRMRPLTLDRPKALVDVAGRPLVDHMLDRLAEAGVTEAVVNLHAFADQLEAHLRARARPPRLAFSDERAKPLETGGGIKAARDMLGDDPVLVANIDSVWIETGAPAIPALIESFDLQRMDALLLVTKTEEALGFDGLGDFLMDDEGRLTFRRDAGLKTAPYAYIGVHMTDPRPIYRHEAEAFGLVPAIWGEMAARGRLCGLVLEGAWMHVGDPAARAAAERKLTS